MTSKWYTRSSRSSEDIEIRVATARGKALEYTGPGFRDKGATEAVFQEECPGGACHRETGSWVPCRCPLICVPRHLCLSSCAPIPFRVRAPSRVPRSALGGDYECTTRHAAWCPMSALPRQSAHWRSAVNLNPLLGPWSKGTETRRARRSSLVRSPRRDHELRASRASYPAGAGKVPFRHGTVGASVTEPSALPLRNGTRVLAVTTCHVGGYSFFVFFCFFWCFFFCFCFLVAPTRAKVCHVTTFTINCASLLQHFSTLSLQEVSARYRALLT